MSDIPTNHLMHKGIVEEVTDNAVKVKITQHTACSACHQKNACSLSEEQTKIIEAQKDTQSFLKGEEVNIVFEKKLGKQAVLIAYFYPFLLLFTSLFIFSSFISEEIIAGLLSLCILLFYSVVIYLFRNRIQKQFVFKVKKLNTYE